MRELSLSNAHRAQNVGTTDPPATMPQAKQILALYTHEAYDENERDDENSKCKNSVVPSRTEWLRDDCTTTYQQSSSPDSLHQ
jgi:hypothetical protein